MIPRFLFFLLAAASKKQQLSKEHHSSSSSFHHELQDVKEAMACSSVPCPNALVVIKMLRLKSTYYRHLGIPFKLVNISLSLYPEYFQKDEVLQPSPIAFPTLPELSQNSHRTLPELSQNSSTLPQTANPNSEWPFFFFSSCFFDSFADIFIFYFILSTREKVQGL